MNQLLDYMTVLGLRDSSIAENEKIVQKRIQKAKLLLKQKENTVDELLLSKSEEAQAEQLKVWNDHKTQTFVMSSLLSKSSIPTNEHYSKISTALLKTA